MHGPQRCGRLQPGDLAGDRVAGVAGRQRAVPLGRDGGGQRLGLALQLVARRGTRFHVPDQRLPGPFRVRRLHGGRPVCDGQQETHQYQPDREHGPIPTVGSGFGAPLRTASRRLGISLVKVIREQVVEQRCRHSAQSRAVAVRSSVLLRPAGSQDRGRPGPGTQVFSG